MPCRDFEDDVRYVSVEVDRPETVQMLCDATRALAVAGIPMSAKLMAWYEAHRKEDEARLEAERQRLDRESKRKVILSKLSKEEKKILGLA